MRYLCLILVMLIDRRIAARNQERSNMAVRRYVKISIAKLATEPHGTKETRKSFPKGVFNLVHKYVRLKTVSRHRFHYDFLNLAT